MIEDSAVTPSATHAMNPARRAARCEQLLSVIREEGVRQPAGPSSARRGHLRPLRYRPVVLAVAVAVAGAVAGAGITAATRFRSISDSPVAQAATPPSLRYQLMAGSTTPRNLLLQLADAAAAVSVPPADGDVRYSASQAWYLHTAVDGENVTSKIVPFTSQVWTRRDGSRRTLTATPGQTPVTSDLATGLDYDVRRLSTDPTVLTRQLSKRNTLAKGPVGYVEVIREIWLADPPTPAVQAAMLRLLAGQPGLEFRGAVTDRLGRHGLAVAITSDDAGLPTRHSLILNPTTGMVLGHEEELTTSAGKLNVPIPSVIGYEAWTTTGWVKAVGETPTPPAG